MKTSFLKGLFSCLQGVKNIFYPNYCINCNINEPITSLFLCIECNGKLPYANYDNDKQNPVLDRLKLMQKIEAANALFYYTSQTVIQRIIHQIKYNNHKTLNERLGYKMGEAFFLHKPCFQDVDVLLPVPLAPKRKRKRGYNQAELLCLGIQKACPNIQINTTLLQRIHFTKSQTHIQNKYKRFLNVQDAFVINPDSIKPFKHIIIIDDVITTGATLSTCIELIHSNLPNTKISVLSLCVTIQE